MAPEDSPEAELDGNCDVIVIGGGAAGTVAAIAAARLGCFVALVQDRPVLGGNSSTWATLPSACVTIGSWSMTDRDIVRLPGWWATTSAGLSIVSTLSRPAG